MFLLVLLQGHLRQFARAGTDSKEIASKIGKTFADKQQVKDITPCHRVGRVLRFSPVVGTRTPPSPRPQASVLCSPFGSGGEAHYMARGRVEESQFRRGDIMEEDGATVRMQPLPCLAC